MSARSLHSGARRIALVVHPDRLAAKELAQRAREWWENRGDAVTELTDPIIGVAPQMSGPFDFAVSFGGDGTMLRTVELLVNARVPVLGVNLGNLGYLTQVEPVMMESAFARLAAGDYEIEERMMLSVRLVGNAGEDTAFTVVNEVALEKTTPGHTVRIAVSFAGKAFLTYVADGIVIASPTGSTAYNLSLRGPILSPTLRAVVLTPISPHMLFDRSLVLGPDEIIRLDVLDDRPAVLVVDGSIVAELEPGTGIEVLPSEMTARIVCFGGLDFHAVLRSKFNLTGR